MLCEMGLGSHGTKFGGETGGNSLLIWGRRGPDAAFLMLWRGRYAGVAIVFHEYSLRGVASHQTSFRM
jgi:hypothetical protein